MSDWIPQRGDRCVDYRRGGGMGVADRAGPVMTVQDVTPSMVITSTGERYRRFDLHPLSEGPHSARTLLPPDDHRVQVVRGVDMIRDLATMADNLTQVDHASPVEVLAAIVRLIRVADETRRTYIKTLGEQ